MDEFTIIAERAARAGGQVLLDWIGHFKVREKGPSDLVTEADLASQNAVIKLISEAYPTHDILGEEDAKQTARTSDFRWVIDPLDGTTNYVHQVPHYCVSVALEQNGRIIAGCVFEPVSNECFTATAGKGAFLNGQPIRVSHVSELSQALVVVGFPTKVHAQSREILDLNKIILSAQAVRRTGSAALNLSYVACGRFDAYWARETKAWDVAAGVLLIQEAGGMITGFDGKPFTLEKPRLLSASTKQLYTELFGMVGDASLA